MGENVREVAERILFSSSLEDKLLLGPRDAEDNCCKKNLCIVSSFLLLLSRGL